MSISNVRRVVLALALFVAACGGPQLGTLDRGESGRVVRAYNGDTLVLDSGLRVFLAEVDAPRGKDDYASQAEGELEALALHREVLLAYGGTKRWAPANPDQPSPPPPETAIAHVFVRSEGGRWFWLQHAMVTRGAAFVRTRRDNQARTEELLALEAQAREAQRGLWSKRGWRILNARAAVRAARSANVTCLQGDAPYRFVEGTIGETQVTESRASFQIDGAPRSTPFSLVAFGDAMAAWDGPPLSSLMGAHVRARGPLGIFDGVAELCLEDGRQLEVLESQ